MSVLGATFTRRVSATFDLEVSFSVDLPDDTPVAALFGPSGCGKSTTLAVLAGLLRPDRGFARVDGTTLVDADAGLHPPPEERAVGRVAQDGLLFPHLDVDGNLRYAERRRRGRPAPSREAVVATLGVEPLLHRRPTTLSGGERQRVALARALLAGPRLLLLDEPVSALDEASRREVLDAVAETVRTFRVPTLFVSHQVEEVLRMTSVVIRMDGGRVVACGEASAVLGHLPARGGVMNLLRAVYDAAGDLARGPGEARLHLPEPGSPGEAVWCRIPSGAIALEPVEATAVTSARNRLRGEVVGLRDLGRSVRVEVDVGVALQIDVTAASARALGLRAGSPVACVLKAHAMEVIRRLRGPCTTDIARPSAGAGSTG